jgi:hypothetical protein
MGRKKTSAFTEPAASRGETQTAPEAVPAAPAADAADPRAKLTNREMVRNAILAGKTKPQDGVGWIRDEYGVEMNTNIFSTTKSQLKTAGEPTRSQGEAARKPGKKRGRKPKATTAAVAQAPAAPKSEPRATVGQNHSMRHAEAARAVKDLVDKIGADEVRDLADLFGG